MHTCLVHPCQLALQAVLPQPPAGIAAVLARGCLLCFAALAAAALAAAVVLVWLPKSMVC
jgi:hypothetical protein